MLNILKNKIYLSMIISVLVAVISFVSLIFIKNQTYFTIILIVNILINFLETGFLLLIEDGIALSFKFRLISLTLLATFFMMVMDVVLASFTWDLHSYSNLMYLTNIKFFIGLYSIFVIAMVLMAIYVVLKGIVSKPSVRQKSTKQ